MPLERMLQARILKRIWACLFGGLHHAGIVQDSNGQIWH